MFTRYEPWHASLTAQNVTMSLKTHQSQIKTVFPIPIKSYFHCNIKMDVEQISRTHLNFILVNPSNTSWYSSDPIPIFSN